MDDVSKRTAPAGEDLSLFLDPDKMTRRIWVGSELAAILKHQLQSPVGFDLGLGVVDLEQDPEIAAQLESQLSASFGSLLGCSSPSLRLLTLTKDFAKRHLHRAHSSLPREIARVLYLASIAVAKMKCQATITTLDNSRIRAGFEWGLEQPWVDAQTRDVFQKGLAAFRISSGDGGRSINEDAG